MPDLARAALEVLQRNRRGTWTCPAAGIYPHQWLWDSCFVAIGLAEADPERAAGEITAVLRGQWSNGMVPHMVFATDVSDVGSKRLWQSKRDPRAPRDVDTSCITQPPLLAVAAWYVARALGPDERRSFLAEVVPKIVDYHRWLYRERDVEQCGLVTLIHPWECGLDTTPPWMDAMSAVRQPWWMGIVVRGHLTRLVRFLRRDTRYVPAAERSSDDDGLRMLVLAERAKRHQFDLHRLPPEESVLIQDVSFNALLAVANRMLTDLAKQSEIVMDPELVASSSATTVALEELWDESVSAYCSRDSVTGKLIAAPTIATFIVLWAELRPDRMRRLVDDLETEAWWPAFPVPSMPTDSAQFEPARYWKGPTWVNTNWLIVQGLRAQGEDRLARAVRRRTLDLVAMSGFAEYFSPLTGEGYGADEFSWSAALVLELLGSDPE